MQYRPVGNDIVIVLLIGAIISRWLTPDPSVPSSTITRVVALPPFTAIAHITVSMPDVPTTPLDANTELVPIDPTPTSAISISPKSEVCGATGNKIPADP
jgi:hypothetical protein